MLGPMTSAVAIDGPQCYQAGLAAFAADRRLEAATSAHLEPGQPLDPARVPFGEQQDDRLRRQASRHESEHLCR